MGIVFGLEFFLGLRFLFGCEGRVARESGFSFSLILETFLFGEREGCLVAPAPVVFKLTRAPAPLELVFALVLCHRVVEVPGLVHIVDKGVGSAFVLLDVFGALSLLLGKVSLAGGFLRLFFLLFDQFSGESFGHFHLFFGRHPG